MKKKAGKILAIQHSKGGCSKSTVSWNLAIEVSNETDYEVEVVDLDIQQTLTLNNYTRKNKGLKELNIRTFNEAKALKEYLEQANDSKLIIVDTGGFDSGLNRVVALMSDMIITPVSDSKLELQGLKKYEKILEKTSAYSKEDLKAYVLLSRIDPRAKDLTGLNDFINKSKHFETLDTIIRARIDYKKCFNYGKNVVEYKASSKASIEIQKLQNEVLNILEGGK